MHRVIPIVQGALRKSDRTEIEDALSKAVEGEAWNLEGGQSILDYVLSRQNLDTS
ncbi:MAG: hypothetical protein AAGK37_22460 [Pseudomonadota bacterium]